MSEVVFMLVFGGLVCALLMAIVVPPPAAPVDNEDGVHLNLLALGCLATVLTGALALLDRPAASITLGAVAWLVVTPCMWLARAPRGSAGWEEEDEDDGGGSSPPPDPSAPPAPDDRLPGLGAPSLAGARGAWSAAPASGPMPATASAQLPTMPAELPAWALAAPVAGLERPPITIDELDTGAAPIAPIPVQAPARRRVATAPRRRSRGDHRTIAHIRGARAHGGRRRRGSRLRRWMLRAARRGSAACPATDQGSRMILPSLPPAAKRS